MIHIKKPPVGPAVLSDPTRQGLTLTEKLKSDYEGGARDFKFDSAVYGHKTVKTMLLAAQSDKCAFCESKFKHIAYGDVEHFRPKGGWVQSEGDDLAKPGYYWLAYAWSNLFASCTLCNQRFKRNFFPLSDPTKRALSHRDDVSAEPRLLVDPEQDDPEEQIRFRQEVAYPVDDNEYGQTTIRVLGLDREELDEVRRDRLVEVELWVGAMLLFRQYAKEGTITTDQRQLLTQYEARLKEILADDAEYCSMFRCAFGHLKK